MIILDTILICVPLFFIIKFMLTVLSGRRDMKKLSEWALFNKKVLSYAEEIKDENIRQKYLNFCVERLMIGDHRRILKLSIKDIKNEIIEKYSNHIPSLKSELRESKLNQILK